MTALDGWQTTTIIVALIGGALAALRMYFPPRHVIDAEEKRPKVIGCEAGQHVGRLHDRNDRMQDSMAKVSEAIVRLTALSESMSKENERRAEESTVFHRNTSKNFETTHQNQRDIKSTIEDGLQKLSHGLRVA